MQLLAQVPIYLLVQNSTMGAYPTQSVNMALSITAETENGCEVTMYVRCLLAMESLELKTLVIQPKSMYTCRPIDFQAGHSIDIFVLQRGSLAQCTDSVC